MANVRCVMMQKNERRVLEAWIKYYGYMFSYENLYIFDNGSTDQLVLEILAKYEKSGVKVFYDRFSAADFENKGDIIKDLVDEWDKNGENYDFILPIDCDEFILFSSGAQISVSRNVLHAYLDNLDVGNDVFIITHDYINDPKISGLFYPTVVPKSLFPKGNVGHIDHGFHHPRPKNPSGSVREADLGYIHFHNKPFSELLQHAKEKLKNFVDISDTDALRQYEGNGLHLTKYFFMSDMEYKSIYNDRAKIYICGIINLFINISIDADFIFGGNVITNELPFNSNGYWIIWSSIKDNYFVNTAVFDYNYYLSNHEDLSNLKINPLAHFAEFGFKEGRFFNSERSVKMVSKLFLFNTVQGEYLNMLCQPELMKKIIEETSTL